MEEKQTKTLEQKVYRTDRNWFELEEKRIVGDMYYAFQEADNFRTLDAVKLREDTINWAKDDISNYYDEHTDEDVPIYFIQHTTIEYELYEEEDLTDDILPYGFPIDNWVDDEVIICCSKQYAEKIGLLDSIKEYEDYAKIKLNLFFIEK